MLYLATLRAGLVYLPLNTAYQQAEIEYFLGDAQPDVVVCAPARRAEIEPLARRAKCRHLLTLGEARDGSLLQAAAPCANEFETRASTPDGLAAILYTSGTTGRSKGAMLSHGNLASNALTLDEFWGFAAERAAGRQDVLLHALPLFHVHGLFVASHAALLAGAKTLLLPKFDPAQVLERLPRSTVFMGVPTYSRGCWRSLRSTGGAAPGCGSSSRGRHRFWPTLTVTSSSVPAIAFSSATACPRP